MPANNLSWMLWCEDDPKAAPQATVEAAAAYFRSKYGRVPNHLLAPLDWPENISTGGLLVERKRFVLPRHLHLAFDPDLITVDKETTVDQSMQGA